MNAATRVNELAERVFNDQSMIADLGLNLQVTREDGRPINIKVAIYQAIAERYLANYEYHTAEDLAGNVRIVITRERLCR